MLLELGHSYPFPPGAWAAEPSGGAPTPPARDHLFSFFLFLPPLPVFFSRALGQPSRQAARPTPPARARFVLHYFVFFIFLRPALSPAQHLKQIFLLAAKFPSFSLPLFSPFIFSLNRRRQLQTRAVFKCSGLLLASRPRARRSSFSGRLPRCRHAGRR